MLLAERDTLLGKKFTVREIRKLSPSGHQTAILSTDFRKDITHCAAAMFARWCQENFFRYMREHYNLDRLVDYSTRKYSWQHTGDQPPVLGVGQRSEKTGSSPNAETMRMQRDRAL